MLCVADRRASGAVTEAIARAESHGYDERAGEEQPDVALMKLQPLSLRGALAEAQFLEAKVSELHASGKRGRTRA